MFVYKTEGTDLAASSPSGVNHIAITSSGRLYAIDGSSTLWKWNGSMWPSARIRGHGFSLGLRLFRHGAFAVNWPALLGHLGLFERNGFATDRASVYCVEG